MLSPAVADLRRVNGQYKEGLFYHLLKQCGYYSTFTTINRVLQAIHGKLHSDVHSKAAAVITEDIKGALLETPRSGLRPLNKNSKGKYLSRCLRISNNSIPDLMDLQQTLCHFLAQPSMLTWLDVSFNKISCIEPVLCELRELRGLYLHGNSILKLSEVDKLRELQHLHTITLHGNAIERFRNYRKHVISALPQLKRMDFSTVTHEERVLANVWRHCSNRGKNTKESPQ